VLAGRDTAYAVDRPLRVFNTDLGIAYAAAGVLTRRDLARGRLAAGVILALHLAMLGLIGHLFRTSEAVAVDSVRAMALEARPCL
jgi:hypothetical protein